MDEREVGETWINAVNEVLKEISKLFRVEAAILFGSWARSGGEWSDIDLLIVTDDVKGMNILDRFAIVVEFRRRRVDVFLYTYDEVVRMSLKGNPLILSVLIEGIPLVSSDRVERLRTMVSAMYRREGRVWIVNA